MSSNDDVESDRGETKGNRFYGRPGPDESSEVFGERFRDGVLEMIAEYRREHPEEAADTTPTPGHEAAIARGQERLRKLRAKPGNDITRSPVNPDVGST